MDVRRSLGHAKTALPLSNQAINTITDTLGRVITFNYDANGKLTSITQGSKTHVTFSWDQTALIYDFSLTEPDTPASGTLINVITGCRYPNQTGYDFIYGDWGIVKEIKQVTSGGLVRSSVSYNYPPAAAGALADHPTWDTQTVFDSVNTATWTYGVTKTNGLVSSFAVTSPTVNGVTTTTTTNLFTSGWQTGLVDKVTITSGGSTLRTVANTWTQDNAAVSYQTNPRLTAVVSALENGQQSQVGFSYTTNGNVSELREYDYGATAPTRKTQTDYSDPNLPSRHILDRPTQVRVYDAAGSLKARTDFAYDTTALQALTPVPTQWADPGAIRGNVTSITRYTDAATAAGPITRTFIYDTAGNLRQADLDCCQQRAWLFTATTQYAYPESITSGPATGPQLTSSRSYDFDTGLVISSTDENGKTTSYEYDTMNRLKKIIRPDLVEITTSYNDSAAQPQVTRTTPIEATKNLVLVTTGDGLGRTIKQETKDAVGGTTYSIVETQYDALGRVSQASNPYAPGEMVKQTANTYDALGRLKQVDPPGADGVYTYNYSGNAATLTDPAGKERKTFTDALGRLVQVHEPGPEPATTGSGYVDISGGEQSTAGTSGTPGSGSVTISGSVQSTTTTTVDPCCRLARDPETGFWMCQECSTTTTVYDSGTVWITVNGSQKTVSYGQGSTADSIASALRSAINGDAAYPVTAGGTGATVTLTAKQNGASTNYSLSAGSTYNTNNFASPSFTTSTSGAALTGGSDGTPGVYDSGTVWITVNGSQKSVSYRQGSRADSIATALRNAINGDAAYPVTATGAGARITLTAKLSGASTNYPLSAGSTYDTTNFTAPSFTATPSGSALTGGSDGGTISLADPLVTTYSYDPLDNLTQVIQDVQTRSYNYDSLGRLKSATTPEAGTVNYTYTSFSQVQTRTDARGVVTTYGYDGLNRLKTVSYTLTAGVAATSAVDFFYGDESGEGGAAANAMGRLTRMTDGVGSEAYTYHAQMPWTTKVTKVIDATSYVLQYGYNLAGELTSITYPSGRAVTWQYDAIGRLNLVASQGTNYLTVPAGGYNAAHQPESFNYGNGVQGTFSYNARLQLQELAYKNGATDVFKLTYNYGTGNNGQIQSITDSVDASRSMTYTYDAWGRLKTATAGPTATPTWKLSWDYDRYGNRRNQNVLVGSGPGAQLSISESTNRITDTGFSYDAAGNLTQDALNTYTYDAENRIKAVNGTGAAHTYDGSGLRVKKVVGSTTTRYTLSGSKVIAEYTEGGLSKEYIYAGSQLLASLNSSGTPTYHHADHLSIRVNSDIIGNIVGQQGHYPFGESWYSQNTTTKWQFTSYERDLSDLDYATFRYDSSRLGRFMTPDPLAGTILNPQSLNRYAYVNNDPVGLVDPLGLQQETPAPNVCVINGIVVSGLVCDLPLLDEGFFPPLLIFRPGGLNASPRGPRRPQPNEQQRQQQCADQVLKNLLKETGLSPFLKKLSDVGVNPNTGKITFNLELSKPAGQIPAVKQNFSRDPFQPSIRGGVAPGLELSSSTSTGFLFPFDFAARKLKGDVDLANPLAMFGLAAPLHGFMDILGDFANNLTGGAAKPDWCQFLEQQQTPP